MTRRRHDLESLLEVAVRVYTERGFDGTSMGDLAAAAGLSKSSLYHHVESKEQLLRLALDRAVEPCSPSSRNPERGTGGRSTGSSTWCAARSRCWSSELPYVTLLLRVRGNSETERWALDRRREFDHVVAGLVAQAAAEGDVRGDVDPGLVSRLLFGMVNSLVEWYDPQRVAALGAGALADAVVRQAFEGLTARR